MKIRILDLTLSLSLISYSIFAIHLPSEILIPQSALPPAVSLFETKDDVIDRLVGLAGDKGSVRVIIGVRTPFVPEGSLIDFQQREQRARIRSAQKTAIGELQIIGATHTSEFKYIPYVTAELNAASLLRLKSLESILSVEEDVLGKPGLNESIPLVRSNLAWNAGFSGIGQTVAIVDSGVDKNHSFLTGRVISEACYSSNIPGSNSSSVCPGGVTESVAPDSGLHCPLAVSGCAHGTHVAGIAAGRGTGFSGVAKDANIVAVQVFSRFDNPATCGSATPCARYWTSDLIRGLERVRTLANTMNNIAAVNLSLQTGQQFTSNCDASHSATKAAIDNLRSVNIGTAVCSGNFAFTNALTAPACISTSISVGSVDDGSSGTVPDVVSSFSDSSPLLHLLGPGRWVNSSTPGNIFEEYAGTSMATPHVTGAFAVLRQRNPSATVTQIADVLSSTGQPVLDARNNLTKPRIKVFEALQAIGGRRSTVDFDGDGKTDVGIFRPSVGEWWYQRSSNAQVAALQFGLGTDKIVPGDFTGDGKTDIAVWRPSDGHWFVLRSEDGSYFALPFGLNGDIPAPADYDGDGRTDPAVFRPTTTTWFISNSGGGTSIVNFGISTDKPVVADYDGDAKADIAIWRAGPGEWWGLRSTNGSVFAVQFGSTSDRPVQGDYTGDGKADIAFWRPADGNWFVIRSEDSSYFAFPFGSSGDIPVPGDYDGDGRQDSAVFRPSNATWFLNRSTAGVAIQQFGLTTDTPIPSAFVP